MHLNQGLAYAVLKCKEPIKFYKSFMCNICSLIVSQTNVYGREKIKN